MSTKIIIGKGSISMHSCRVGQIVAWLIIISVLDTQSYVKEIATAQYGKLCMLLRVFIRPVILEVEGSCSGAMR
jgi:hypothetical protein